MPKQRVFLAYMQGNVLLTHALLLAESISSFIGEQD
jgi:hypothetical protein